MALRSSIAVLSLVLVPFILSAESQRTDGEVWNEGVSYYEKGDYTNALRVLRPLMLSKSHGARASEVVAALSHAKGDREEAAAAAQIALRAAPSDGKANRNFTRAIDGLLEERETKRINAILKAAEGKDHGEMLRSAAYEARNLIREALSFRTNSANRAVMLSDSLSKRAMTLADVWYPVRETVAQSVTNEEQAATIIDQINQATAKTKKAAKDFSDLSADAYGAISDVEHDFTRFLKLAILPPAAIDEALLSQSNAFLDVEAVNGRDWQYDSLDYTRSFRAKFPAWARAWEQRAQSDTNLPPFTAEAQAKISSLATEAEKLQLECCEKSLPPQQEKVCDILNEIRELLPKDKNGGGGGKSNSSSKPQSGNDKKQENKDDSGKENENQPEEKQGDMDEAPPEEEKEGSGEEEKSEPTADEKEIDALLRKAQERNDEHEAEKKARMRKAPLPPNERDW